MARRSSSTSLLGDLLRAVGIALFIISLGVVAVLYFRPLYYLDVSFFHLDTASGLEASVVRRNYDVLCDYLFFWNRGQLHLPDFVMSERGRIHFADCKVIFDVIQVLCLATGILTLIGALRRKHTARCRVYARSTRCRPVLPVPPVRDPGEGLSRMGSGQADGDLLPEKPADHLDGRDLYPYIP